MIQTCIDEFEALDLPFKTYISTCIDHGEETHEISCGTLDYLPNHFVVKNAESLP